MGVLLDICGVVLQLGCSVIVCFCEVSVIYQNFKYVFNVKIYRKGYFEWFCVICQLKCVEEKFFVEIEC